MKGLIHSFESFGTLDGPGVRYVVFFQGCPMRCKYCHNPDTWNMEGGTLIDTEQILNQFERNKDFYTSGGITATGGEPMLQLDFLIELFEKAKSRNIHTCLDTSGVLFDPFNKELMWKIDRLLGVCDLILLDIKHIDEKEHKKLTNHSNKNILAFSRYLNKHHIPVWIRHVVVPEITFKRAELRSIGKFIKMLTNVKNVEVLPYHSMAKAKYHSLGIDYSLQDTPPLTKEELKKAHSIIMEECALKQVFC